MKVATKPTSSELRPPYSRRTARSRPFWSAPSRNLPCQVGPIGRPLTETTSFSSPPTLTLSVTWLSFGPVCATWSAYSGAQKQRITMIANSAPKASATLLRRRRRRASLYGPMPAAAGAPPPGSATTRVAAGRADRAGAGVGRGGIDGHRGSTSYLSETVDQSLKYSGWKTASKFSLSLKNFGTASAPYTAT